MSRVEKIGNATLYLGDCREILPTLGRVDAVVTDPPFFTPASHYQSRIEYQRSWSDLTILIHWWDMITDQLRLVCGHSYCFVFCGADSYAAFYPSMFAKWRRSVALVWDKKRVGLGRPWRRQHELIIAAIGHDAFEPPDGELRGDVLAFEATLSRDRDHPVEKPAKMLAELIRVATPGDGVVCDPFMGSGTTGVASFDRGRRFIGIEIEPRYFDIACKRIDEAQRQGRLFDEPKPKAEQLTLVA